MDIQYKETKAKTRITERMDDRNQIKRKNACVQENLPGNGCQSYEMFKILT
jgi:hypothetical protein